MKPNPFQILKMLPQTNCKDCGFETCLALATYLYAYGPERIKKCPHIDNATKRKITELFGETEKGKAGSMIAMWEEFRKNLIKIDIENLSKIKDFSFIKEDNAVIFKFLGDDIVVTNDDIKKIGGELSEHDKILIYYYINCAEKLSGEYEFCDYRSFYSKLIVRDVKQEGFEIKLQEAVGNDISILKDVLNELGSKDYDSFKDLYDLSMLVNIFPNVPVLILYSKGEEEFAPYCKFMFDEGCSICFDSEGLEYLADYLTEKIISKLKK